MVMRFALLLSADQPLFIAALIVLMLLDSAMRLPLHSDRRENEHISSAKDNDAGKDGDQPFPEHTGLSILQIFSDYVIHYPL